MSRLARASAGGVGDGLSRCGLFLPRYKLEKRRGGEEGGNRGGAGHLKKKKKLHSVANLIDPDSLRYIRLFRPYTIPISLQKEMVASLDRLFLVLVHRDPSL